MLRRDWSRNAPFSRDNLQTTEAYSCIVKSDESE